MSDIEERTISLLFARSNAEGIPKAFLNSLTNGFVIFTPNKLRNFVRNCLSLNGLFLFSSSTNARTSAFALFSWSESII